MPLHLTDLPHDLLHSSLRTASARDMGRMGRCSRLWLQVCDEVAERRLRARRTGLPPGSSAHPCWLRSLGTLEQIDAAVGPAPSRSWRDEYVPLMLAAERAFSPGEFPAPPTDLYGPGGDLSIDVMCAADADDMTAVVQAGFSADDAAVLSTLGGTAPSTILVRAFLQRSTEFAAITHRLSDLYFRAALRAWNAGVTHGRVYQPLGTGPPTDALDSQVGLIAFDPAWGRLTTASVGDRIEIVGTGCAYEPIEVVFQDDAGIYTESASLTDPAEGEAISSSWNLEDSDVVCFLPSRPADRGGHYMLVHEPADPKSSAAADCLWGLHGPFIVTLEAISEPGEWQVRGLRVRRRLYSVSVSFG